MTQKLTVQLNNHVQHCLYTNSSVLYHMTSIFPFILPRRCMMNFQVVANARHHGCCSSPCPTSHTRSVEEHRCILNAGLSGILSYEVRTRCQGFCNLSVLCILHFTTLGYTSCHFTLRLKVSLTLMIGCHDVIIFQQRNVKFSCFLKTFHCLYHSLRRLRPSTSQAKNRHHFEFPLVYFP